MYINIKWFDGKYPSFNVGLASSEQAEEFLSIKGCKIKTGPTGEFVSWPSTKNQETGKYWNHVWANEKFGDAVLAKAKAAMPQQQTQPLNSTNNIDETIPF